MTFSQKAQFYFGLILFFFLNTLYMIWSFALTDPNLVFSQAPAFWSFQQFMWQIPKQLITQMYFALVTVMFCCVFWMSSTSFQLRLRLRQVLLLFFIVVSPLLFSNNALSHDVFNYIFNARMVVKYQMNPHVEVAQHFFYDPWIRFMHNVHTPAPYFYGWTALSLPPYILGFEKFLLTFFLFRLWSVLSLSLCLLAVWMLMKKVGETKLNGLIFVLFNPLILIELISNTHNDGWMMGPALLSLAMLYKSKTQTKIGWFKIFSSFLLLLISISTKYVTVILLPVWLWIAFEVQITIILNSMNRCIIEYSHILLEKISLNIFDISAVLLFIPLLTERSQQFHPWYLSWCLLFLPVMKNKYLKFGLGILTLSSMLRYFPWMWNGAFDYNDLILSQEKMITWVPLIIGMILFLLWNKLRTVKLTT